MSRIDENGVVHPTESDPWDVQAKAHLAYCRECSPYALPMPEYQWGCQIGGMIYPHDDEEGARRDAAYKSKGERQVVRRLKAGSWEVLR